MVIKQLQIEVRIHADGEHNGLWQTLNIQGKITQKIRQH